MEVKSTEQIIAEKFRELNLHTESRTRVLTGQALILLGTEFIKIGKQMCEEQEQERKPQPDDAITQHYLEAVGDTRDLFEGDDIYIPGETQSQKAYDENEKY